MKITILITRDGCDPPNVPGSIAHSVPFPESIDNHHLLQAARDAAEKVALAYLVHGLDGVFHGTIRPIE